MKFSYNLFKKYLPKLESKAQVEEALNMHVFETEKSEGDTIDVSISANRYSDGASHIGIAKELELVLDFKSDEVPDLKLSPSSDKNKIEGINIKVEEKDLCPRYTAQLLENVEVKDSPDWLKQILKDCGIRPINNVVDVMNYVMLETGQPLHAFDADEVEEITVRKAKKGEKFTSIDGNEYELFNDDLVIAGKSDILAIAGIKGGKSAEVTSKTKNILIESANFDGVSIYKTSKVINLVTDASLKFSHNLNQSLAIAGLKRAEEVLVEVVGAKPGAVYDSNPVTPEKNRIPFDFNSINKLIGFDLPEEEMKLILQGLDFEFEDNYILIPVLRDDIGIEEDIAEEVVRIYGLNNLESKPPVVGLIPSRLDNVFMLRSRVRSTLIGFGFSEVYLSSFIGEGDDHSVEMLNPISTEKKYLRNNLTNSLLESLDENRKFFSEVRIFEIGKSFLRDSEKEQLGIAIYNEEDSSFLEIKGVVEDVLESLGITDYSFSETTNPYGLAIKMDEEILGAILYKENKSVAEINLDQLLGTVEREISFKDLPKYPAVERDISFIISDEVKIGEVIQEIQLSNTQLIKDVDLVDEYFGKEGQQSITLRIVFQSEEKTLNSEEVNKEMDKINSIMGDKFSLSLR
ncbi:MAG: phenylalanine--tRNA ligase subunit beta [Candidatus Paceibacterota bacterium]